MSNFANPQDDTYALRIILASGTAALPSIVFANDLTSGLYWDSNGLHLSGMATPVNPGDATNKAYVDSIIAGGGVNPGTQFQLAYYATTGSAVSGLTLITASRALASNASGLPVASVTTAAELAFVNGVTSAIQTQLNGKQATLSFPLTPTQVEPPSSPIAALDINWLTTYTYSKTLSANSTFTFSNAADGMTIIVALTNTASNYTVTWPTVKWSGGTPPVQTIGAFTDIYTFVKIGSVIYGTAVQNFS